MTAEEERVIIAQAQKGDNEAMTAIITYYHPWMYQFLNKYHGDWREEFRQQAMIGIMMAVKRFDPSRASRLKPLASYYVRLYIMRHHYFMAGVGKVNTRQRRKLFVEGYPEYTSYHDHMAATEPEIDKFLDNEQLVQQVTKVLDTLDQRDRHIVMQRLGKDKLLREVGDEFGVTRERIRQIEERVVKVLKKRLRKVYKTFLKEVR